MPSITSGISRTKSKTAETSGTSARSTLGGSLAAVIPRRGAGCESVCPCVDLQCAADMSVVDTPVADEYLCCRKPRTRTPLRSLNVACTLRARHLARGRRSLARDQSNVASFTSAIRSCARSSRAPRASTGRQCRRQANRTRAVFSRARLAGTNSPGAETASHCHHRTLQSAVHWLQVRPRLHGR